MSLQGTYQTCFIGSVNSWECDENDHQNVRFYSLKINQALQAFLVRNGFCAVAAGTLRHFKSAHLRYHAEARTADPLRIDCGLVGHADKDLSILALVYNNLHGELLTSSINLFDATVWAPVPMQTISPPDAALPRSIDPQRPLPVPGLISDALATGYLEVGAGVVGADECDENGILMPHNYIGRISDGIPNLLALIDDESTARARAAGALGNVVVEYHFQIHSPLQRGHLFSHLSGIREVGGKSFHLSHLILDHTTGCCAFSVEAVALGLDLDTRRAIPIARDQQKRLEQYLLTKV